MVVHQQTKGSTMSSKATKLNTSSKVEVKLHTRALIAVRYKIVPFISRAFILAGACYALVKLLENYSKLPAQAQGSIATVVFFLLLVGASQNKK